MTMTAEIATGQLEELVEQVKAGNEVLLTQDDKLVAKLIPVPEDGSTFRCRLTLRAFTGHRVITPLIRQEEIADDLFND
jgi:antitoxin (DNA-binding transcriptional repressor) of toxin-antitoxin stability system